MRVCSVDGCGKKYNAKGYCRKHYTQYKRHGSPVETANDPNIVEVFPTHAEITLKNKHFEVTGKALVDLEDLELALQYKWYLSADGYVVGSESMTRKRVRLHRWLMKPEKDLVVDHINGNRLDNRRSNLRICTKEQNIKNRKLSRNSSTGVTGVIYLPKTNNWKAHICINGEKTHLGYYANKEDAIKVRREAELLCYGEFSPLWNDFMQNSVPDELDRQWYIDEAKKRIKGFTGEIL